MYWLSIAVAGSLVALLIAPLLIHLPETLTASGLSRTGSILVMVTSGIAGAAIGTKMSLVADAYAKRGLRSSIAIVAVGTALTLVGMLTALLGLFRQ